MAYTPNPLNTSTITLTPALLALAEQLAHNNHEVWAQARLAEGWRYGPERNDARKENPCLVPYEDLPEAEKDIDRRLATQTLKALLALGYRLDKMAGANLSRGD